ncbi:putative 60S ribosomal protein L33 [Drosophila busckii]|uniref:putative 60S ribosomal protein L33 n=1 Tax=Drosophila busckii TaxID=30019 RepID=UPI00143307F3|nr:putative 60S ribosomal protein L33 [Drosophila busckii]
MSDNFKFKEIFDSNTLRGRANVAKATWASVGIIYMLVKMRRNSKRRDVNLYCKRCQQKLLQ